MLKKHLAGLLVCLALVLAHSDLMAQRYIPASVLKRVEAVYTEEARTAKIRGTVALECLIRKDGTVSVQRTLRGLGYGLDESARVAIEQWRFKPQIENGKAVDVTFTIEVNFPGRPVQP